MFKRKHTSDHHDTPGPGFISRLRARLNRGDSWLTYDLARLVPGGHIDDELLEELETRLLGADVGVDATEEIIGGLRKRLKRNELKDVNAVVSALRDAMLEILAPCEAPLQIGDEHRPWVILFVGVNGAGKTTTLGKLARRLKDAGLSTMLAAGDTFRAAAVEQLRVWGERNQVPVVSQETGADPAAVIFDAMASASARKVDVLLADTAGRLQSQAGLMDELSKIVRVMRKADPSAPHEILLVLDAGIGQNALSQAREFHEAVGLTGLVLTKLDGTAKGGVVLNIARAMNLPIRLIGIGEKAEDLDVFRATDFVDALLGQGSPES
jgi:fused signal recognition particle receptor